MPFSYVFTAGTTGVGVGIGVGVGVGAGEVCGVEVGVGSSRSFVNSVSSSVKEFR